MAGGGVGVPSRVVDAVAAHEADAVALLVGDYPIPAAYVAARRDENKRNGWDTKLAFVDEHGRQLGYWNLRAHFQTLAAAAGLGKRTPHDMRHTFAVRLLESARGGNIQSVLRFVASQVGDDVKTVVDTYLNGGYTSDDATEYDGALVDVVPRAGVCPTCRRPTGRAVVRELRAVRA
jgi:hypothetical protein